PATVHPVRRGPCRGPEAGPPAHDRSPSRAASDRTGPGPPDLGSLAPGRLNGFAEGPGGRRRRACYGALTRVAERRGEHVSWGGRDFTRGATLRQLATFSGPIVLANLLQTLFQLVDSLWVGNLLGAQALGAVAISGTVIFVALAFVIGMNNAALAILAQHKGRRDERAFARYLNAFAVILLGASVLLGLAGFLGADGALRLLGTPAQILAPARDYLQITFVGMPFLFGYNFLATVLRAIGDPATPLRFTVAAVALNTVLDPLLIHTAGWGVRGAALATVVSQGVAFGYGLVHVARRRLVPAERPHPPAAAEVRMVLRLGIPAGLQMAVISAGSAAIMSVVTAFGADVVGGYGAAQRLDALVMLPAQALGI